MPDLRPLLVTRRGEQQAGDELGGTGGVQGDAAARDGAPAVHRERDRAPAVVADQCAEFTQRREQLADRPLRSAAIPGELRVRAAQRGHRRNEAHHGTGVADVDDHAAGPLSGRHPPGRRRRRGGWGRGRGSRRGLRRVDDHAAQRAQGVRHQAGVPGGQRASDQGGVVGQRGQDEGPVGHRLGPWYRHQCPHRPGGSGRAPAPAEPAVRPATRSGIRLCRPAHAPLLRLAARSRRAVGCRARPPRPHPAVFIEAIGSERTGRGRQSAPPRFGNR